MKTIKITLLAAVLGLMSFTVLPTVTSNPVKTEIGSPAITWKSEMIDLGQIPQSVPKHFEFEFTNTGKTDVIITNVQPTCGCTAADYTKTPIKPGEKGVIKAIFNAAHKGAFTKTIKVTTNADAAQIPLSFKGTVI